VAPRRELTFLLAAPERRLLQAIAARLPRWVTSDGLTILGMVGALGTGAAYALSTLSPAWLWAASALLVVQWFGDSLDGTLARVRHAERPRYGYYVDHIIDAFSTAAIGAGIGLSPYVDLGVALAGVLAYLILSINIYLESQAFGVFRLGYSRIGPTEARVILVAANVALAWSGPSAILVPVATGAAAALVIAMLVMGGVRIGRNLSELARLDSLVVGAPGRASARHEETVIASVLQSAPLLTCVTEPRGGDEQLGLEARAELPIDDLNAVARRPEELAELDTEGEALGLVEIRHKGGVVVEWR
jgi:phosphatidylglycerophosphate synthase